MIYDNLEYPTEAMDSLKRDGVVYYDPVEDIISSNPTRKSAMLEMRDKDLLKSFYKKVYFTYSGMSCASYREHRLIQLDIEFNQWLDLMKEKYGG